jgi:predicted DNA-binding WGR domain protein
MTTTSKQEKRFQTTVIVTYSRSNATRKVSFDTFEEAKAVVEEQRQKHPRSKKFNGYVFDSVERRNIVIIK